MSTLDLIVDTDDGLCSCLDDVQAFVNDVVENMTTRVDPEELGLDRRVGSVFVTDSLDCIVARSDNNTLMYYGDFEYVDKEHTTQLGDWVVFHEDCDRVDGHLERLREKRIKEGS